MLRLGQLGYPERLSIRASVQDHQGFHSRFQKLQGYGIAAGKSQLHIDLLVQERCSAGLGWSSPSMLVLHTLGLPVYSAPYSSLSGDPMSSLTSSNIFQHPPSRLLSFLNLPVSVS